MDPGAEGLSRSTVPIPGQVPDWDGDVFCSPQGYGVCDAETTEPCAQSWWIPSVECHCVSFTILYDRWIPFRLPQILGTSLQPTAFNIRRAVSPVWTSGFPNSMTGRSGSGAWETHEYGVV